MSARSGSVTGLGKTRVEALTDGIFGAVMTVLGLSLTIPYITGPARQDLPALEDVVTGAVLTPSGIKEAGAKDQLLWPPLLTAVYAMAIHAENRNDEVKLSGALHKLVDHRPAIVSVYRA